MISPLQRILLSRFHENLINWLVGPSVLYNVPLDYYLGMIMIKNPEGKKLEINKYGIRNPVSPEIVGSGP